MYAVEFETRIEDDIVHIPHEYNNLNEQDVIVFIIQKNRHIKKTPKQFNPKEFYGSANVSKQAIDCYLNESSLEWERE